MPRTLVLWLMLLAAFVAGPVTPVRAQQPGQAVAEAAPSAGSFRIVFDAAIEPGAYSGRVYVALAKGGRQEPRATMGSWFGGSQVFSIDVSGVAAGGAVVVNGSALGFPKEFAAVEAGEYSVQAVARRSPDYHSAGKGPGDMYSTPMRVAFAAGDAGVMELRLTEVVAERPFRETDRIKLVEMVSPSLSAFFGREVKVRAGVALPEGWKDNPAARYPTLYFIGGFGGDHNSVRQMAGMVPKEGPGSDVLLVVPDPSCFLGHSVFADSANNGPRGKALMEELIPEVEKRFHGAQSGSRRYVTGISSGGWSCLWLQVTYPDSFAGCWSHCPDPVDFRDFQRIDLYAGENMYTDPKGERRPLARQGERVMLWYDDFVRQETVMGPGGQIHSFEAVFGQRGADGKPVPLFDRATGKVDPAVAKTWEPYDIRLVIERNWATLGPKLKGKLHIYAGEVDTFYLEGAARLLGESLKKLGSDAEVEIVPGMPHTIHQPGIGAMFKKIGEGGGV